MLLLGVAPHFVPSFPHFFVARLPLLAVATHGNSGVAVAMDAMERKFDFGCGLDWSWAGPQIVMATTVG